MTFEIELEEKETDRREEDTDTTATE